MAAREISTFNLFPKNVNKTAVILFIKNPETKTFISKFFCTTDFIPPKTESSAAIIPIAKYPETEYGINGELSPKIAPIIHPTNIAIKTNLIAILVGCIIGAILGLNSPLIPYSVSGYLAIGIMAALDSVFGGIKSVVQKNFDMKVFVSGFFINSITAVLLTFLGNKLNVDISLAAIIVFVGRIFIDLAIIRRYYIEKPVGARREHLFPCRKYRDLQSVWRSPRIIVGAVLVDSAGNLLHYERKKHLEPWTPTPRETMSLTQCCTEQQPADRPDTWMMPLMERAFFCEVNPIPVKRALKRRLPSWRAAPAAHAAQQRQPPSPRRPRQDIRQPPPFSKPEPFSQVPALVCMYRSREHKRITHPA